MKVKAYIPAALFAGLVLACSSNCFGQQAPGNDPLYIAPTGCQRCHKQPIESDTFEHILYTEWTKWSNADKHSRAYQVLKEKRAQRMGKRMRKNVLDPSTGCIQCHTSNFQPELWSSACMQDGVNTCMLNGVSCQTCHGPAEQWESEHIRDDWIERTDEEKARFGLKIMEDPLQRAEMCLSCHQGDASLDRVITHEMYAAGHPTLSGFEMEAFADKMPRHWRYSHEKPGGQIEFDRTRAVLLGSVVALRMAVAQAAGERDEWPELARLECYSCHHELRTPTWRHDPGRAGISGRPRLHLGSLPLVRASAIFGFGPRGAEQFENLVHRTEKPFEKNVFGDPAALVELEQFVAQWCADLEQRLQDRELGNQEALAILTNLITTATQQAYDFDTSRQLSGAMAVICEELAQARADVPYLSKLRPQLNKVRYDIFELSPQEEERVELRYPVILERRARYQPEAFTKLMVRFQRELSK